MLKPIYRSLRFIFTFYIFHFTFFLHAQEAPSFVRDSLDAYVQNALTAWQIPGVAVCIVKDGKVVLMKGYGVKEMGGKDKVDEHTLFMIGSNTKAFTATALALLEADKKISLDDKVQKWMPDFTMHDPWVGKEMMIRDLLCHRIGMETFQGDFMYWTSDLNRQQVLKKFEQLTPKYGFRSRWGYTNAAFLTAGELIPKITGKTWDAFLQERIFSPLQMNETVALSADIGKAPNKAAAHTIANGKLVKIPYGMIDNLAPAGSISSSANDLSHWILMQLNSGNYNGNQVVPQSAINQTRTPNSILGNGGSLFNKAHFALYGLGWFLEEYDGRKIVSHTGGVNGFVTSVTLVPEEKLGIVVLTNTDQNNFYEALKWEILDAYLQLPYRNYSKVYLGFQQQGNAQGEKWLKSVNDSVAMHLKPSLPLSAYAGTYKHEVYGTLTLTPKNNGLEMRLQHHPNLIGNLQPLGGDRFLCTYSDPEFGVKVLPFTVSSGKVKSMTLSVADFVEFTTYDFVKQ
jgi:CubicO group peptidase (beta-lactamase class C family)